MKYLFLITTSLVALMMSCNNTSTTENTPAKFQNKGHELVYTMVQKVGNYDDLLNKKDVVYTYTYQTPDTKTDITTERYIFDGEMSHGTYHKHERTFPELEGSFEQSFDGTEFWLKHKGEMLTDEKYIKRVAFNRPTNFYWFTMMPKLLDPNLKYEYINEKIIDNLKYDVVKISFESTNNQPTDIYQIYINQETSLVDQFLFTVADFGVMETPFLMKVEYEKIDGLFIPSKRLYKKSTWDADVSDEPWIKVTWSDIKFNNNLDKKKFKKSII